ncbi:MAG: Rnf-Nqr domain containing protein, partial [Bacteroidales bacterium]|nr:Rnf-Nqr domain containing protein [Bacteroidales bacterium]MDD2577451.1 Rnf-Nqr domain containing protein [Bacteroidales bacterium]MDD4703457.1 Rnf-Nqr domain containing protein [Bacteroidales bacterium]
LITALVYSIGMALGFTLAMVLFAGIREKTDLVGVPKGMQKMPIVLVTAGILAMAFMGFAGLVKI